MTEIDKNSEVSPLDQEDRELTKEEHITNYIKILDEIQRSLEPFREHASDLKKSYIANNWLTKEEMTLSAKAYRMLKSGDDLSKIWDYIDFLKKNIKI